MVLEPQAPSPPYLAFLNSAEPPENFRGGRSVFGSPPPATLAGIMTQKSKSQFASLPQEDQKLILELCSRHEYSEAVEILSKPRSEGGLNIHTSRAALCRFFTQHQADSTFGLLAQLAAAANIRHEQHSNAFLGAFRPPLKHTFSKTSTTANRSRTWRKSSASSESPNNFTSQTPNYALNIPKQSRPPTKHIFSVAPTRPTSISRAPTNRNPTSPLFHPTSPTSIKRSSRLANATRKLWPPSLPPASHPKTSKRTLPTLIPHPSPSSLKSNRNLHPPPVSRRKAPQFHQFRQIPPKSAPPILQNQPNLIPPQPNLNPTLPLPTPAATIPAPAAPAANQRNVAMNKIGKPRATALDMKKAALGRAQLL